MHLKKIILSFVVTVITINIFYAQSPFTFSGYADGYVAYYTDSLDVHDFQKFPTVSPRSGQFGLNIAQISAKYNGENVRATVALHYGDIPLSAWSPTFNMIQEANAGVRLCKKVWLDAGFFRTHIGTEALLPKENVTSSIAVPTFYEPYYEAGMKIGYAPNDAIGINLYVLNGYNLYEDNNRKKSAGILFTWIINDHLAAGYDDYIGDDFPDEDSISHLRFFNNVYLNYEKNKIKIIAGADFSFQQHASADDPDQSASAFGAVATIRYQSAKKFDVYARGEIFSDPSGFLSVLIPDEEGELYGLKTWGATVGVEYKPTANGYIRVEARDLAAGSEQKIFYRNGDYTNARLEAMLHMGVWF